MFPGSALTSELLMTVFIAKKAVYCNDCLLFLFLKNIFLMTLIIEAVQYVLRAYNNINNNDQPFLLLSYRFPIMPGTLHLLHVLNEKKKKYHKNNLPVILITVCTAA